MNELFEIINRLKTLEDFTKSAIEGVLKIKLERKADANPFSAFYHGEIATGPFSLAEYSEPGKGATSQDRRLTLSVRPDVEVLQKDVSARYGPGEVFQVIPEAKPEGRVTYVYREARQKVFFQYSGKTYRLLEVTICRGECR